MRVDRVWLSLRDHEPCRESSTLQRPDPYPHGLVPIALAAYRSERPPDPASPVGPGIESPYHGRLRAQGLLRAARAAVPWEFYKRGSYGPECRRRTPRSSVPDARAQTPLARRNRGYRYRP